MRWRTLVANGVAAYKSLRHEPIGAGRGAAYIQVKPKQTSGSTKSDHAMPTTQEATNVTHLPQPLHLAQLPLDVPHELDQWDAYRKSRFGQRRKNLGRFDLYALKYQSICSKHNGNRRTKCFKWSA